MNTGIFDCGRLRQISLRVATVVLAEHSFDVPLHKKTFPSEMSGCNQSLSAIANDKKGPAILPL
ncbi:hypothetical protein F3B47_04955 [Bacteroides fragilis]|nr:hypothetical protein F3B36_18900 [Bacteroides fragilis]KAA4761594.1 hypothetical protein F3B25_16720 [Bacteroides fragilis]KAA4764093.1 hypothetical protein F3B47_04955 [Bacteroides fragilis]KAA4769290.1 hypothetical protein F3B24_04555 [Bacteroides fragilis]KAA4780065.1 hypothetical protein F3B40_04880 [Bacteroides fragilis]